MKNKLFAILMIFALILPTFVLHVSADSENVAAGRDLVLYRTYEEYGQIAGTTIEYVEAEQGYLLDVKKAVQGARYIHVPLEAGYTYRFEALVKSTAAGKLRSFIEGASVDSSVYSGNVEFNITTEYQPVSFDFAIISGEKAHIGLFSQAVGSFYIKDAVIKKVPPQAKTNLIPADKKLVYYSGSAEVTTYNEAEDAFLLQRNDKVRYTAVSLEKGKTYVLEARVKYTSGNTGGKLVASIEGLTGTWEEISTEENCVFGAEYKTWKTKFTIDANASTYWPHLGYQLILNGPAYVRITVKEYTPDMIVTTTGIANGDKINANEGATINYTFSNKPYEMKTENITVTPAATVTVTKVDLTNYTVVLSDLASDTAYTVSLANVQDMYTNPANSTISFTTNPATLSATDALTGTAKVEGNKLTLNLASAESKTVYVMVASYEGTKMTAVQFEKVAIGAESIPVEFEGVSDTDKVFVWDTNLAYLCNAKFVSELR